MGGRPQKREKASGRKRLNLGSTWNVKRIHVGMLSRLDAFRGWTLERWNVGTLGLGYGFTLGLGYGFTLERWNVGTLERWNGFTGLRWKSGTRLGWDAVTLRRC